MQPSLIKLIQLISVESKAIGKADGNDNTEGSLRLANV
jgi:hypothetical protein